MKCAALVLAAGSSSRMGQPKQSLKIGTDYLLTHTVREVLAACSEVLVVTGANAEADRKNLEALPVTILENKSWQNGMGNSLKVGLQKLLKEDPSLDAVLISVCDQPLLSFSHVQNLMQAAMTASTPVVASAYENTFGVPALFKKEIFGRLLSIDDREGAKKIIQQLPDQITTVAFPGGAVDIDTMEDYQRFIKGDFK